MDHALPDIAVEVTRSRRRDPRADREQPTRTGASNRRLLESSVHAAGATRDASLARQFSAEPFISATSPLTPVASRVRPAVTSAAAANRHRNPRIRPMADRPGVVRRTFVATSGTGQKKRLTPAQILAMCEHKVPPLPPELEPIVHILAEADEEISLDGIKWRQFLELLQQRDREMRPHVWLDEGEVPIPGELDPVSKVPKNWALGDPRPHQASELDDESVTLAHVTYKASNLHNRYVDPDYGSNPGEFGFGFYMTTGHDTEPQQLVSQVWGASNKAGLPKEIVKFKIANTALEDLVDRDPALLRFLVHMLRTPSGYPAGMSEHEAVEVMNRINRIGKVLIFPDSKDTKVLVDDERGLQDWHTYTDGNAGPSDHLLVIGPNRPPGLAGVRQVVVRGGYGALLINAAKRSQERIV